jgi:hypothetical protein
MNRCNRYKQVDMCSSHRYYRNNESVQQKRQKWKKWKLLENKNEKTVQDHRSNRLLMSIVLPPPLLTGLSSTVFFPTLQLEVTLLLVFGLCDRNSFWPVSTLNSLSVGQPGQRPWAGELGSIVFSLGLHLPRQSRYSLHLHYLLWACLVIFEYSK